RRPGTHSSWASGLRSVYVSSLGEHRPGTRGAACLHGEFDRLGYAVPHPGRYVDEVQQLRVSRPRGHNVAIYQEPQVAGGTGAQPNTDPDSELGVLQPRPTAEDGCVRTRGGAGPVGHVVVDRTRKRNPRLSQPAVVEVIGENDLAVLVVHPNRLRPGRLGGPHGERQRAIHAANDRGLLRLSVDVRVHLADSQDRVPAGVLDHQGATALNGYGTPYDGVEGRSDVESTVKLSDLSFHRAQAVDDVLRRVGCRHQSLSRYSDAVSGLPRSAGLILTPMMRYRDR